MFESLGKMLNAVGKSLVKFSLLITGVVIFINAFIITPLPAHADSLNSIQALIGFDAPNTMEGTLDQIQGKAQQNLGTAQRKAGEMTGQTEGALNQAKGKAQQNLGTVQRKAGEMTGQTEGALNQAKGKAQQGVGEVKNRLDNASDNAEEASENMLDSVKNLFGQ
jgi:uncharacterized protein YjbJ (UPF0337 family)